MEAEWQELKMNEVSEVIDSLHKSPAYSDTGYPMVRVTDIKPGFLDLSDTRKVSEAVYQEFSKKYKPQKNDIVFSRVGSYGISSFVNTDEAFCLGQNTVIINPSIYGKYLYYFFQSNDLSHQIESRVVGTTQKTISLKDIRALTVKVPPLSVQKAIAHVLGTLDDKIELNRKTNETLEAMAQALFKSWFVDFDPVIDSALAAGNDIPEALKARAATRQEFLAKNKSQKNLPDDIRKLFPNEFEFIEEVGWVPKGWCVKKIGDLLETVSKTYPLKEVDEVIFLNTGDISEGKFLHENLVSPIGLPGQAKKTIQKADILYSEIRPKNKRFAYVYFDSEKYVVSTKLMVLREKTNVKSIFCYLVLKQEKVIAYLQMMAESRSGTFPQITYDVLSEVGLVLPVKNEVVEFFTSNMLEPIFEKQLQNDMSNAELIKLRDTLLPKLLSGELRIPDAEKLIENIA